ncbi:MAG: hypothetical protein ACXWTS_10285 [Methylococcaceae bacterium]
MDILAQDFYLYSSRINSSIASYVTVDTTQKTDKKTSQNAQVIKLPFLKDMVKNNFPDLRLFPVKNIPKLLVVLPIFYA